MARTYTPPSTTTTIGAVFSAAYGSNTKSAVISNGQTLNKSDYPELAAYFGTQPDVVGASPSSQNSNFLSTCPIQDTILNYSAFVETATNKVFVQITRDVSGYQFATWTSANGEHWKLASMLEVGSAGQQINKIVSLNNRIFICEITGIWMSTDEGVTYTKYLSGIHIRGVAFDGTNYLILPNNTTGIAYLTTNFSTFTTVTVDSGATAGIGDVIFYNGKYYAFVNSTNRVRESTNGTTWSTSALSMPGTYTSYGNAFIVNNILVLLRPINSTGTSFLWHTTNPSSVAWAANSGTWSSSALTPYNIYWDGSNYNITGIMQNASSFGHSMSVIGNTPVTISTSATFSRSNCYTFAFSVGSNIFYINSIFWATKSTTPTTSIDNSYLGTNGIPIPFFTRPQAWYSYIGQFAGITQLGKRYIAKFIPTDSAGNTMALSVCVEESGYFIPLTVPASFGFAAYASSSINSMSGNASSLLSFAFFEDSTGYCCNIYSGLSSGTHYMTSYNSSKQQVSNETWTNSNYLVFPGKTFGIYMYDRGSTASASRNCTYFTPTSYTSSSNVGRTQFTVSFTAGVTSRAPVSLFYSAVDNDVLVLEYGSTPSNQPNVVKIYNGVASSFQITFATETGTSVSANLVDKIFKLNNQYYVTKGSEIYRSPDGITFTRITSSASNYNNSNFVYSYQYSQDTSFIPGMIYSEIFGAVNVLPTSTTYLSGFDSFGSFVQKAPYGKYWIAYCGGSPYVYASVISPVFNNSTQFKVPTSTAAANGTINYIIAR